MTALGWAGIAVGGLWGLSFAVIAATLPASLGRGRAHVHVYEPVGEQLLHDVGCPCGWHEPTGDRS